MENENLDIEVTAWISNLPRNIFSKNTVKIYLDKVIEESIVDESGVVKHLESYESALAPVSHIRLHPRFLTSSDHLSQLLRDQQVPYCGWLGQQIAIGLNDVLHNDDSLREPVFVTIDVKYIQLRRLFFPPIVSAPRCASAEVLQRLVEEHSVESTCSICIESLSGNIIRMPQCLHMFHQDCLFEWLGHHNSCPLCRRVPYEEESQVVLA